MFKQFLMSGGMQFCQIDSARMSGVNEVLPAAERWVKPRLQVLAVYLMAAKLGIPVCPHAGGVGLCNMVPHLQVSPVGRG
jgi:L-fuconate dehydratase